MQTQQFCLPDLGEGLTESEIVAWHVGEGDHVVADQPLVSVETEKAVVEVPAPFAGTVVRLYGAPGDIVKVGQPLVELDGTSVDAGTVVGEIPAAPPAAPPTGARAAPAVRNRARTLGVELGDIAGTGPGHAITMADVERAVGLRSAAGGDGSSAWLPLRRVRRTMARQMSRAGADVVPATLTDLADVHGWPAGADPTVRLVRAISAACTAEPALNAWYDPQTGARLLHRELRLGLAVDTIDGLIVPVVGIDEDEDDDVLRARLEHCVDEARQRRIAPAGLSGATFTLSNFGTLGGRHGVLVVMPPQVAILGAGRIEAEVVAADGVPAVHRLAPLSLTFDHRVVSGGEAARFMRAVVGALQSSNPQTSVPE
ncbi:MAG: dihydrolipoamide acetyltransferase family protein [Gammaproteobacteria bacterium]